MSEINDDPREVLVLLNSLGFVGITAIQLKAFMKDLKLYRKIKEREKQQRKEEIKTKIINKQQTLFRHGGISDYSSNNIIPSKSLNSHDNESMVKVRIRCIPKEGDVQKLKCSKTTVKKSNENLSETNNNAVHVAEFDRIRCKQNYLNIESDSAIGRSKDENNQGLSKSLVKDSHLTEKCQLESKSISSDPTTNIRVQSTLSTKSSINLTHKSFIRPWRLQSEVQKNINKRCDPVALYQKYQQEWKQISFPGEAKHSKIRWAVREKMLGTDPHPVPLSKRSITNMPILKRK